MKAPSLGAEDDRNLRRVLRAMLVREGYDVAEAADGEAASAWLSGRRADVLITDIRMPKMDGLALFRHPRERHPDVPVILITAYGTIGDAVEAIRSGAFDYISKPFDEAELLRVVGNAARTSVAAAREGAGRPVHQAPRLRHPAAPVGGGSVRVRKGGVHRGRPLEAGAVRAGGRGDLLSGRDRGCPPRHAGETSSGPAGPRVRAGGRGEDAHRGRPLPLRLGTRPA